MNLSHMKNDLKTMMKTSAIYKKIHTRNLKCSFHLTGTKMKRRRAGANMATD
jgi:hypothetical protein